MPPSAGIAGENAGDVARLPCDAYRIDILSTQGLSLNTPVGNFTPEPGASWSKSAGQAAAWRGPHIAR